MSQNQKPAFAPLPHTQTARGDDRLTGVEIEFAGLTEDQTAELIRTHLGGEIRRDGSHDLRVTDTELGEIEIVLDTALRKLGETKVVNTALDALRGLVPVEIVTEPLDRTQLIRLDVFRDLLRQNGAIGTAEGILLGFGVHLNVTVTGPRDAFTWHTVLAFALLQERLRRLTPIDTTRRLMPFVEPWPDVFVTKMAAIGLDLEFDQVRDLYAQHCNSRNYALDLLPIFQDADPGGFARLFPDQTNTKGRPAFHFRLPDCRVDQKDWSLNREWQRWRMVEQLAADSTLLTKLTQARRDWTHASSSDRANWEQVVTEHFCANGTAKCDPPG